MSKDKKFSITIIALGLVIVFMGIIAGTKESKQNISAKTVNADEQCIITIQEEKYDVTEFKYKHPGGDIFKCGQDMTEIFQKAHKGYLPMIEKLKIK